MPNTVRTNPIRTGNCIRKKNTPQRRKNEVKLIRLMLALFETQVNTNRIHPRATANQPGRLLVFKVLELRDVE